MLGVARDCLPSCCSGLIRSLGFTCLEHGPYAGVMLEWSGPWMRSFLAAVVMVSATALLAGCTTAADPSPVPSITAGAEHPNIVFVLTDDLSMNLISSMPHVQQLQRTGRTMSNFFVVDSLCCPSRTATLTGQYPHDDGVFTNSGDDGGYSAFESHANAPHTFGSVLHQAGYRTALMGKYLNGYQPTDPVPQGWDEWDVAGNGYPEFNYDLNENGTVKHYGRDASDYLVDVLAGKGSDFIRASAAAHKPFMLEVATFAPHAPYTPAPRYAGTTAGTPYPKTASYDTLPSNPPSWLKSRPSLTGKQQHKIQTAYDKRLAADKAVDDLIGSLQNAVAKAGQTKETDVVFSSDNGYHMGEYRLMPGKQTAFDTDIHVPLIASGPGIAAGSTTTSLTSNIDLAPTFETLAGAPIDDKVDGVSLASTWKGGAAPDREGVLIEHHGPDDRAGDPDRQGRAAANPPSYEAVRTRDALYVLYTSGEEEYYDLRNDPLELHNLGSSAVPASTKAMLTALTTCHGTSSCVAAARGPS